MNFNDKFDKTAVLDYLKNQFLPDDFTENREAVKFTPGQIKEIEYIGESKSLELKLFVIRHESEHDPRVTLSRETFRVMGALGAQRALAIFHSSASPNWRLSLATIELSLKGAKTKREYSNPRRYSFFLGPEAKTHTLEQFLRTKVVDFPDLHKRFSIEVVNEKFYKAIARKFTELVGGNWKIKNRVEEVKPLLRLPSVDLATPAGHTTAQEFAVRLIGRIVFCWFLKKKKSPAGEPLLPDSILSTEAVAECEAKKESYLHSVLENVFFQVLNTEVAERAKEFRKAPYNRIPFLNGGLFEPHNDDAYCFDPFTASSESINTLRIDNSWFENNDDDNPGLLNILESYNFTIDENTSVDVELAVDPEMLGRIFENLLAEINPETGETARKSTGSFYTPRHIVEYMVDESLKEYLKAKTGIAEEKLLDLLSYSEDAELKDYEAEKIVSGLDAIKIIDPACGSGAFPMGMLQKIVLILQKVDPGSEKWLEKQVERIPNSLLRKETQKQLKTKSINYIRKMGILRDCIYGVDIQETATEISKLRFFLSLIIDEDVDDAAENRGVEPLPNLEFKFVCANTLIQLPGGDTPALFEDEASIKKLKNLREQYFRSSGKDKKALKEKFSQEQTKIFNKLHLWHNSDTQSFQLSTWKPFENKPSVWFDPDWMFGIKDGFDIVIANPPYVRQEDIKQFKTAFKAQYSCFTGTADLYVYFYERGFQLLRAGGILTFISSNKYFRSGYGEKLRGYLATQGEIKQLIDFGDAPVFTAIAYPSIIIVSKAAHAADQRARHKEQQVRVLTWNPADNVEEFVSRFNAASFLMPQSELKPDGWRLESAEVLNLLAKLHKAGKPLGEYVNGRFYYGIKTGLNEAFVVDRPTRDRLIAEHKSSAEVLKPFLRGRDVKRWRTEFAEKYLIKIESSDNKKHPWSDKSKEEAEKIFAKTYPAIHAHFQALEKIKLEKPDSHGSTNMLEQLQNREDQGKYFWELRSCAYWQEFEAPKIILGIFMISPTFAFDDCAFYHNNALHMIAGANKFLVAMLNSSTAWWFLRSICTDLQGGYLQAYQENLSQIPIPTTENVSNIEKLVDKILAAKGSNSAADVSAFESEIDQHVYKLYNLTNSEIQIIEGGK